MTLPDEGSHRIRRNRRPPPVQDGVVACRRCGVERPAEECVSMKVGGRPYCSACREAAQRGRREKDAQRKRGRWFRARKRVVDLMGGWCHCKGCTVTFYEHLTIEPIFNPTDAKVYSAEERGAHLPQLWIVLEHRRPQNRYRLVCFNCQGARRQYGYCPHEDIDA